MSNEDNDELDKLLSDRQFTGLLTKQFEEEKFQASTSRKDSNWKKILVNLPSRPSVQRRKGREKFWGVGFALAAGFLFSFYLYQVNNSRVDQPYQTKGGSERIEVVVNFFTESEGRFSTASESRLDRRKAMFVALQSPVDVFVDVYYGGLDSEDYETLVSNYQIRSDATTPPENLIPYEGGYLGFVDEFGEAVCIVTHREKYLENPRSLSRQELEQKGQCIDFL